MTNAEGTIAQQAAARGARVWSTPWSPPANFKDNGSVNGGNYVDNPANNASYAGELASYVTTMKNSYGVTLYAVSVQNEPDVQQSYESCQWTSAQIHDFVPHLAAQLTTAGVGNTKIVLPEDEFWQWNLATDTWNDTNTAPLIGILAAHDYNNNYNQAPTPLFTSNLSSSNTVPVWETEHYFGSDDSITNGLQLAQEIHNFMTVGNANAYHYWWLEGSGNGSIVGNSSASPAKRLFVMGNYSRFVRPNFYRIGAANTSGALVSAYKDPRSSNIVIVAANPTTGIINQTFVFANAPSVSSMIPWITSATLSLANQAAITVPNGSFTYALPPLSVISFVTITPNDSFEAQPVADGTFNNLGTGAPTGWNSSGVANAVVALVNPGAADGRGYGGSPVGLDGNNYCQIYATGPSGTGMVYQDTGVKYQAGTTYHLTAAFGMENGTFATGSTLCLYNSSLAVIASTVINAASLTFGAFKDITLNYTSTGSEDGNGDIFVGFSVPSTASSAFFDFDNVRLVTATPPVITTQPAPQSVPVGGTASLSVGVTGTGPFGYQWQATNSTTGTFTNLVNGGSLSGATNSILAITNVTANWSMTYRVIVTNLYGGVTSSPAALTVYSRSVLINGDFGSGATQTGAAVLGVPGDVWNAIANTSGALVNSSGNPVSGVGYTVNNGDQFYVATAGTPTDTTTTNLMEDYAFGFNHSGYTLTIQFSITGLTGFAGDNFNLVLYAAGNTTGQGATLNLTGATGGNTASTLTTSASSRQISAGAGVAYQTFTGILTNSTLTVTATENAGQSFTVLNGFQLQLITPASTNAYLTSLMLSPVGILSPAFASNTFVYFATNFYGVTPTVTVTNADLTATNWLIYDGATNRLASGVVSAPLVLTLGMTNMLRVQVTAQDGVTLQTYNVNVTELPNQSTPPSLTNSLSNGMLNLSWDPDRLGYRLLMQTNNLNLGVSSNPNDWATVVGSMATNTMTIPIVTANLNEYFQLVYP